MYLRRIQLLLSLLLVSQLLACDDEISAADPLDTGVDSSSSADAQVDGARADEGVTLDAEAVDSRLDEGTALDATDLDGDTLDASPHPDADPPALCAADQRVEAGQCVPCPPSTTNDPGDDPSGPDTQCSELVWPNPLAPSNSHPWLRAHHNEIARLEPRVLVLDVLQAEGLTDVQTTVDRLIASFAEMSRYHGYLDPEAPVFLQYQIDKIVDLRDPGGADYPDDWPTDGDAFDVGALFTEDFAPRFGYEDPEQPGRYLTLCELFERGAIHELWIAANAGTHAVYENQSRMQVYDADLNPIAGRFETCTNGCYHDPHNRVSCSVTVRMQEINKTRGPGCGTHASGHTFENLLNRGVNPYLQRNATRFLGFDLSSRYGITQAGQAEATLYACDYAGGDCVYRDTPNAMRSGPEWGGEPFDIDDWGAGCGNIHFPPNATTQYDYYTDAPALASCEGYGLGEGPGGDDAQINYNRATVQLYEAEYGDCGGGWMVYWGQSFPGYGNHATDTSGDAMLNWWPFWFY